MSPRPLQTRPDPGGWGSVATIRRRAGRRRALGALFGLVLLLAPLAAVAGPLRGDTNCDGRLDETDLATLLAHLFGVPTSCAGVDVNGDGAVSTADIIALMQLLPPQPPTSTPTATEMILTPTASAVPTETATAPTPTGTPPTATETPPDTDTPTRSATPSVTRTPEPPTPTVSSTASGTRTGTATPSPTGPGGTPTDTRRPTRTPTGTETPTFTRTATRTPTRTRTRTPTDTPLPTFTRRRTLTPTPVESFTPTGTPPTAMPGTPTHTSSPTPTSSVTTPVIGTPTATPSRTDTATGPTQTETRTLTPTRTGTETRTPSRTRTLTPTLTPSNTRPPTSTQTPSRTATSTRTVTETRTPSVTRTQTLTRTPTQTRTETLTPTLTPTRTQTRTPTATVPRPVGPEITYFGIATADNRVRTPSGQTQDGVPIFDWPTQAGFIIVVETRNGTSNRLAGSCGTMGAPECLSGVAALQVIAKNALGNGSAEVCDDTPPLIGGVPAANGFDFSADPQVTNAINDFACRFDVHASSNLACTFDELGNFAFVRDRPGDPVVSNVQFCTAPAVGQELRFPPGPTRLKARVLDVNGNVGNVAELVVETLK